MPVLGASDMDATVPRAPTSCDRFEHVRRAASQLGAFLLHALIVALLVGQASNAAQDESQTPGSIVIDLIVPTLVESVPQDDTLLPEVDTSGDKLDAPTDQLGDARPETRNDACSEERPSQGPWPQTMAEWRRQLQLHFARFKRFPAEALMNRVEGTSLVLVTVCRNGHVQQSRVIRSSGAEILDKASLELVQRAIPLPILPDSYREQSIDVVVPIEYSVMRQ